MKMLSKLSQDTFIQIAEAVFTIINALKPISFAPRVQYKPKKLVEVKFNDELSSLNNAQGSTIDLGYTHCGRHQFVLAGTGTEFNPFVSSNPPVQ